MLIITIKIFFSFISVYFLLIGAASKRLKMTDTSEIEKEYLSSLSDLNVNSKPLINMLTILAEENIEHGQVIVDAIEKHITKVTNIFFLFILPKFSIFSFEHNKIMFCCDAMYLSHSMGRKHKKQ